MEFTQPVDWINKSFVGYAMNTEFSSDNIQSVVECMQEIKTTFDGAVFCTPKASLHVTLLDWIAPLVTYGGLDKDKFFGEVQPSYDKAITEILSSVAPIDVHFDEIKTSPSTIYIVGHDNGEFQKIREQFMERVELLPGTKLPPTIIHSSLARFTKPIELSAVNSFLASKTLHITQTVTDFRLTRATREPMLEFETLKRYRLK